jgi:copper(I)-binding protein
MERQMKTRFSILLIASAMLALGACMSPVDIAASDDTACRNTGAKQGTPAFVKCLEDRKERRRVAQIEGDRAQQRMIHNMNQSAMHQAMRPRF